MKNKGCYVIKRYIKVFNHEDRVFLKLFPKQALFYTCLQYNLLENAVGKGEIARNEQFLLFPTVFSTHLKKFLPLSSTLKSANSFSLEESRICRLGKVIRYFLSQDV